MSCWKKHYRCVNFWRTVFWQKSIFKKLIFCLNLCPNNNLTLPISFKINIANTNFWRTSHFKNILYEYKNWYFVHFQCHLWHSMYVLCDNSKFMSIQSIINAREKKIGILPLPSMYKLLKHKKTNLFANWQSCKMHIFYKSFWLWTIFNTTNKNSSKWYNVVILLFYAMWEEPRYNFCKYIQYSFTFIFKHDNKIIAKKIIIICKFKMFLKFKIKIIVQSTGSGTEIRNDQKCWKTWHVFSCTWDFIQETISGHERRNLWTNRVWAKRWSGHIQLSQSHHVSLMWHWPGSRISSCLAKHTCNNEGGT